MDDAEHHPGGASVVGTVSDFVLCHHLAAANGTQGRKSERRSRKMFRGVPIKHLGNLRDHIACALDDHPVAHSRIKPGNVARVVERCAGDHHSCHTHGIKLRHGGQHPCSADLDVYGQKRGRHLLWWKLQGQGPAGGARAVCPSSRCTATRFTLATTPSISKGSRCRLA